MFVGGGVVRKFQSKQIINDISARAAYTRGICMLSAPTISTSYVHCATRTVHIQSTKFASQTLPVW